MKKVWILDYEVIVNCFIAVFNNKEEFKIFVVHEDRNDLKNYINFVESSKNNTYFGGFNIINYDSQITEWILKNKINLLRQSTENFLKSLYNFSQTVINSEKNIYPQYTLSIPVIDIYKLNHWDNKNKATSLKWAQYQMDWFNIEEMPYPHYQQLNKENLQEVIDYCKNDVLSTKNIFYLCKKNIELRLNLKNKYDIDCLSYSNSKYGSELLLKLYCNKTNKDPWEVRNLRTIRNNVELKDVVFPYIEFKTDEFKNLLQEFKALNIDCLNLKDQFKKEFKFKNIIYSYGLGGIHQCIAPDYYEADNIFIIKDADVTSKYPNLAIENKLYAEHLGPEFLEVYSKDIVEVRVNEKNKLNGDITIIEGFKEAANTAYGKSNELTSWLYDPLYTLKTTVNGQLLLSMITEELILELEDSELLMTNTDGFTIKFKKEDIEKYYKICKNWENKTNLKLEYFDYSKMWIYDVNNYIALYTNGKTKCKGRFEWEDFEKHKPSHLSKNKSYLIIPKAIYHYFINQIPPEKYLEENNNIFDYCAGIKLKGSWWFEEIKVNNGEVLIKKHKKILRYYISNSGSKIIKKNIDGRVIQTESGEWLQTIFNKFEKKEFINYNINKKYYLNKIYEEINKLKFKKEENQKIQNLLF